MPRLRWLLIALLALAMVPAGAAAQDTPVKERDRAGPPPTPLEQAREEAGAPSRAPTRYALPSGELHVTPSELLASATGQQIRFEATLDRAQPGMRVTVRLPPEWVRTPASGLRASRPPRPGRGDRLARSGRDVELRFGAGERSAAFTIADVGIPAGTYELPLRVRAPGGRARTVGSAKVRVFAAVREGAPSAQADWRAMPRTALYASDDAIEQSEAFVGISPGDERHYLLGINGDDAMTAFVTQDGGASFARHPLPATFDAPGETAPEAGNVCCDPMAAAGDAGDLWFGGLSFANGTGNPSRIVVNRIAAGDTSFRPLTVGLPVRTSGTQDKPMMTIDNAPGSPTYGRLYVVWDEPSNAGTLVVISHCDTRPGGSLDAAHCDDADNWSYPASVTAAEGSYIYPDVAVAPDGRVYVTWWDYSSTNAIRGTSGPSGSGFSAPQTVALLDDTGGRPLPFGCPIPVQPGGRVGPAPGVEVDRSLGARNGRVYVSWGDLRPGSGSTRCEENPDGTFTPPAATHLSWDGFVASKAGGLPGSAAPSASAGTPLFTDGSGSDPASSDEFFPWLSVDQANGDVWADFYSTRDDASRESANFYGRSVTPDGSGGHDLGPLTRLSSAASSYATNPCCTFGNDFGDYEAIDAARCTPVPTWSDNSSGTHDGEAFSFDSLRGPVCFQDQATATEGPGADGDGRLEPGEPVRVSVALTNAGTQASSPVGGALSPASPGASVTQGAADWPAIGAGATAEPSQAFEVRLGDAVACDSTVTLALALSAPPRDQTAAISVPVTCGSDPVPTPTPTAAPPPGPTATATSAPPAPTATPAPPRPPLGLRSFSATSRQRLRTVLRRGVGARLACVATCDAVLSLRIDARTAKRYRLPRQIGRLIVRAVPGRAVALRVRLSARARRALRSALRVPISAQATVAGVRSPDVGTVARRVTLRR